MMEYEEDEFGELYVDNLHSCSSSSTQKSSHSPNLNNVDVNIEQENDEVTELEHKKELVETRVLKYCSELDLETNLIRVLIDSYGLSPVESLNDAKGGDLTDDFALDEESDLTERINECKDLNVGSMESHLGDIRDLETDVCIDMNGEECDEDSESEDSLLIILNDDFNSTQVDSDEKVEGGGKYLGIEEQKLDNDLGMEGSGELGNAEGARVGDHSTNSMYKCVKPVARIKLGGASMSSFALPPHMRVFDISINNYEEKKWRRPSADISDFFNYGLDEEKWKDYCKQLEQLRLESSLKSKLVIYECRQSKKNYEQDLDSKGTTATCIRDLEPKNISGRTNAIKTESFGEGSETTNEMSPSPIGRAIEVEIGTGERLPSIVAKPLRVCGLGAIIEIVSQDPIDESDLKKEDFKEDLELLDSKHHNDLPHDQSSRSSTVHKNIHGDGILPFPLDGSSQHCPDRIFGTRHQERYRGDYPRGIRERPDYQNSERKSWWQKERNDKWRLKQPYEDNQTMPVKERWDYEEHKRILTKSKALKMIHQNTLPLTKRTPYHHATYGNCKVSNEDSITQISKNRPTSIAFNIVRETPKQLNSMRQRGNITSNRCEQDSMRGNWSKHNEPEHYSIGSPKATFKEDAEKLMKRSERFKVPVSNANELIEESKSIVLIQNDSVEDSEIKRPRPARKRRWVSN